MLMQRPSAKKPTDPFLPKMLVWFKQHKTLSAILGIILVLAISGASMAAIFSMNQKPVEVTKTVKPAPLPEPEPIKYYSPLTGAEVETEAATHQAVTGIMMENSPDARPQSGLKNSGVVFEAIAEGGITRFLALYQEQKPQLIGPVRSVRLYYVDWVAAFDASVAHIGGSAAALKEVRNGNYRDIDQFFNAPAYWRASDRYAPHNVYTSFEKLDALNAKKGYTTSDFTGFTRKDSVATIPAASSIDVKISGPLFNSHYNYNPTNNTYDRSQAGAAHTDREAGQISPRVVIAMKVDQKKIFEDGYREQIDAIGSGSATIFQDGTVQEVTWRKTSKTAQITFTDAAGKDVPLARGQTWITAIPNGSGSVSWQ
ncbi:MAG: uncharacterized protein JWO54_368 [Candidatus Saccharibacteria bacterium]|nr:uncharacterized protein [Candidatus Saccharibacteria bacterium]